MKEMEKETTETMNEDELNQVNGGVRPPVNCCRGCGSRKGILYNGYCSECRKKRIGLGKKII